LVLAKTDQGNYARMLVSAGFRKPSDATKELIPILVLERFDTLEAGPATSRIARGRDVVLFDGFSFDLDSGMVVPEGQGGDLLFSAKGEGGPSLRALSGTTLFTLDKSPLQPRAADVLTPGRGVRPGDFQGLYHLMADGQWSGRLELVVAGDGSVSGRFRSDQSGGSYKVVGELAPDAPNRITFSIDLPRSRLEFDGRLWTDGKGAMAGTVTLLDRTYGFVAIREGGRLAPEGVEAASVAAAPGASAVLTISPDKTLLDGEPVTAADFAAKFKDRGIQTLLISAAKETAFSAMQEFITAAKEAGVPSVRVQLSSEEK
jgi:hypothetical protein